MVQPEGEDEEEVELPDPPTLKHAKQRSWQLVNEAAENDPSSCNGCTSSNGCVTTKRTTECFAITVRKPNEKTLLARNEVKIDVQIKVKDRNKSTFRHFRLTPHVTAVLSTSVRTITDVGERLEQKPLF